MGHGDTSFFETGIRSLFTLTSLSVQTFASVYARPASYS
jgi:hypothetical protein